VFKQYNEVQLVKDMMSDCTLGEPVLLKRGQRGVIVEIHNSASVQYTGYDVEFFSPSGETVAVMIVKEADICAIDSAQKKAGELA